MAAVAHLKTQTQSSKPKRRKSRETTISTSVTLTTTSPDLTHNHRNLDKPTVVSPETISWCCVASSNRKSPSPPPPPLPPLVRNLPSDINNKKSSEPTSTSVRNPSSPFKINFSPGRVSPLMDSSSTSSPSGVGVGGGGAYVSYPSNYSNFNSALNAGLLNPMSPPPPPLDKTTRSSPTLFEMMANEQDSNLRTQQQISFSPAMVSGKPPISVQEKQLLLQQRLTEIVSNCSPGNQFNDPSASDVKLTLSSKDGLSISTNVHRQILVAHSRFFASKLSDKWSKQQRSLPHIVEISDCDDVEIYIETLRLMYCEDLRRKLLREDVSKVLGILKVSAAIAFDAGVLSCLEYLEAVPWAEDEEEKIASLLSQLHLEGAGAGEVLKRVSMEIVAGPEEVTRSEEVLVRLLHVVLEGKDEKARREMKGLISKMLRENSSQNDLSKESLYSACNGCLGLLKLHFLQAAQSELADVKQISRQADNLHWILDIMIERQIAEEFLKIWADQPELSEVHSKVPAIHRYEVNRVTARLFVGIGKGQILATKEVRFLLLQTWLEPFYNDFSWMRRSWKNLDRNLIEDGLSNTILTLPLDLQQQIFLAWFNRFLNSSDDCPNIQRGFQVWWRRSFWKRNGEVERRAPHLRIAAATTSENGSH